MSSVFKIDYAVHMTFRRTDDDDDDDHTVRDNNWQNKTTPQNAIPANASHFFVSLHSI